MKSCMWPHCRLMIWFQRTHLLSIVMAYQYKGFLCIPLLSQWFCRSCLLRRWHLEFSWIHAVISSLQYEFWKVFPLSKKETCHHHSQFRDLSTWNFDLEAETAGMLGLSQKHPWFLPKRRIRTSAAQLSIV